MECFLVVSPLHLCCVREARWEPEQGLGPRSQELRLLPQVLSCSENACRSLAFWGRLLVTHLLSLPRSDCLSHLRMPGRILAKRIK